MVEGHAKLLHFVSCLAGRHIVGKVQCPTLLPSVHRWTLGSDGSMLPTRSRMFTSYSSAPNLCWNRDRLKHISYTPSYGTKCNNNMQPPNFLISTGCRYNVCRSYQTGLSPQRRETPKDTTGLAADTGWVVRLANENGYLSWCRNTYLLTVVGVAMFAEAIFPSMQFAAEGCILVSGLNLLCGTIIYLSTIWRLRSSIHMSLFGALVHTGGSVLHVVIWVSLVALFLGYTDEKDDEAADNHPPPANGEHRAQEEDA